MIKRVAILLSGRGSNFLALSDAVEKGEIPAGIALVISNNSGAAGLEHARERGYETLCLPAAGREREEYDGRLANALLAREIDIICLAGYMRILSASFVRQFPLRILNIHPSLLPSFPGLHAQRQALEWGVKVSGCTVHFVDEQLDYGPIILQRSVPILQKDNEETLSARILEQEHQLYPEALKLVCQDRIEVEERRAKVLD